MDDSTLVNGHPVKMSIIRSYESHAYSKSADYFEQSFEYSETSRGIGKEINKAKSVVSFSESFDDDSKSEPVYDLYVAIADYNSSDEDVISLWEGQIVEVLDSHSSQKWLVRTRPTKTSSGKQGWVPPSYLEKKTMSSTLRSIQEILEMEADSKTDNVEREAHKKRNGVVKELIETEEEFARDMIHVVKTYLRDLDNPRVPKEIRDLRDVIFMNFEKICDFHNNILIKGVQYYASEPSKLGRTFLRLERDFDMHVNYCRDIEQSQLVLSSSPAKEYFAQYSQRIGEVDKTLQNHLKLPIQRINDYQLLLKELIKYTSRVKEDCSDLQKALDLMLSIPQRAKDLEFINSIEGYKGNLLKLGRLLRHDWFTVSDNSGHVKERYLFIFKSRILVTKVRRINEDRSIFILKDIIRLPDIEVKESPTDKCRFEFHHKQGLASYPLILLAKTEFIREAWLKEIKEVADEIVDLSDEEIKIESETSPEVPSTESCDTVIQNHLTEENKVDSEETKIQSEESETRSEKSKIKSEETKIRFEETKIKSEESKIEKEETKLRSEDVKIQSERTKLNLGDTKSQQEEKMEGLLEEPKEDSRPTTPGGTLIPHAPNFSMKLKDTEMIEGSSVRFMVKVRAHPEAEVKFCKDGKEMKFDDRVQLITENIDTFELIINQVTAEDEGKYSCHAKNAEGEGSTEGNFTVTASKKVFIGIEDGVPLEGAMNGGEDVDFKWYRDGQEFEASERFKVMYKDEEDTLALVFQHVKPEDAGLYTCVASTASGNIACSAELTVQGAINQIAREPVKPVITAELTDTEVSAGGSAMLELKVSGFPKPRVTWYHDGEVVEAGGRFRFLHEDEESIALVIKNVTKEDSGKYKVVAKNEIGEATTSGQLTVKVPPKFKSQMKDISIMMDELVRFEVEIEGKPTPDISWYKDGRPVVATGRVQTLHETEESFALIIKKVVPDDAGSYSCMASNSSGKISEFCELKVNAPPSFVKEMKRIECKETETIKFEVKVAGSPMPKITWSADGEEIKFDGKHFKAEEDEKNFTLTVDSVTRKDAGKFTCTLINEYGTVYSSADLVVNCTPQFEERLKDVTIKEGDVDVKFDVKLSGTPSPKLRWFIEGMEIDEKSKNFKVVDDGDSHTLILKKVTTGEAGKLTVKASNPAGEASCTGVITVLAKPKFTEQLSDKEVTEGETVTYTVKATGYPKPDIKWYKDDAEVTVSANIKFTHDSIETWTMTLNCVAANSAGNYECRAKNSEGEATTNSKLIVNILMKSEEVIETDLTLTLDNDKEPGYEEDSNEKTVLIEKENGDKENDNETKVDEEETQICEVVKEPAEKERKQSGEDVWWLDEEEVIVTTVTQELKTDEDVEVVEDDEEIPEKSVDDNLRKIERSDLEGPERAEVEDGVVIEEITSPEIIEDGEAKPKFEQELKDVDAWLGLQAILEVKGHGIPPVEAKWFKDGQPIASGDRVKIESDGDILRLVIKETETGDSGKYKIAIKNKIGEVSSEAKLQVKTPSDAKSPVFTHPLKDATCIRGNSVTFEVTVLGNPMPLVKWMKDGVEIKESDKYHIEHVPADFLYKITVDKCEESDAGKYSIFAENEDGEATSEATLTITVPPEITPPGDQTVLPKGSTVCEAKVTGKPQPKVQWLRNGKVLVDGPKFKITSDESKGLYKLHMNEMDLEEAGEYEIQAENEAGKTKVPFKLNFTTAEPKFTKCLVSSQSVKPTTSVQMDVEVDGIPIPNATWHFEGVELSSNDHVTLKQNNEKSHSLIIDNFELSDVGEYTCKAKSPVGEAVTKGKLVVLHEMPKFLKHLPKETCAIDGDSFALEAKIDGSPQPTVKWLKDGKEIVPGERVKIESLPDGTVRLKVDNAKPSDCGKYSVVAKNETGEQVSTGAVSVEAVPKPPVIIGELKKTNVIEGKPLTLSIMATGHPKPTVKWFKDGKPIKADRAKLTELPDGTYSLTIENAQPEDAGKYSAQVSNPLGESTSAAEVTVQSPQQAPEFGVALKGCQAFEGFPVRLEGKVKGYPKPEIKWLKDGEKLIPDGQRVVESMLPDGTFALVINDTKPEDGGKYACIATNPEGTAESSAPVEIKARAKADEPTCEPSFLTPLRDVTVDEGTPLKLQAHIASNPLPDVAWSKDGQVISPVDSRVLLSFDGDRVGLEIKKATPSDAGKYECILTNPHGTSTSAADIGVKKLSKAPIFTQRFPDLDTILGQDARFMCRVSGLPTPDISWMFNDKPIFDSDKFKLKREGDMHALYVKNCSLDDIGNIGCIARNPDGEDKCVAFLNVASKLDKKTKTEAPSFLKRLADCDVIEGMPGKFTACVSGFPEPEFKWYREGQELSPTDRIRFEVEPHGLLRLIIKDVKPKDIGKYSLKITNDHGFAECDANLRCEGFEVKKVKKPMLDLNIEYDKMKKTGIPLALPGKPIISKMTDRRLTLSWNPSIPVGPRVPVTYIVEMSEVKPDYEWMSIRTGIRGCCCEIKNLEPYQDYRYRIRVENKYGISDPSPYATAYRTKLEMTPPRILPRLPPEFDFRPETSPYFPKDYDFDRPPHEAYAHAPRFMRQENDTQYGIRNQPSSIQWYVYGYPVPTVSWYFENEKIEVHGRYESSFSRNGQTTLYINRFLERDVGIYECIAINEHGEARQRVRMEISEPPVFSSHLDETTIMIRESGVLECRLVGVPYPEIKWYKDWHPIVSTDRIKIEWREPDLCTLTIKNAISKDGGLYSCAARNVAGMTSCSAMLTIEENENDYSMLTYNRSRVIKPRLNKQFEDFYDIGDEIGRGTQGIIYHTVERSTGNSYAAKIMHGKGDYRSYMDHELDMMNQFHDRRLIRGIDAFDTRRGLTLITELASGGLLLDSLCRQSTLSESDIAYYVRQILWGLEHMHQKGYAHLGLTIGDILLARPGGDDIKITDFGLTRRLIKSETYILDYGMPEFVAPEIANRQSVSFYTDMWSVGVITYIFLSGISPFLGEHDRHTLQQVQQGKLNFDTEVFSHISDEAKDFMLKLLVFDQYGRMDIRAALRHPWLKWADRPGSGERYSTDRLNSYYRRYKDWVSRSGCRRFYRRRPLSSAFSHPSKMVYPPDEDYTPPSSPEVDLKPKGDGIEWERPTFSDKVDRSHEDIDYELGYFDSESKYQNGPDTYLLQLRDVGLPLRLREYMRVAGISSPSLGLRMLDTMLGKNVTIHERRRFTDIMDEEIDDEKKGLSDSLRKRITSEVSPRSETKNRLMELLPQKMEDGQVPFFREKISDVAFVEEQNVELSCYAVGSPKPVVQWYRNDVILSETHRLKFVEEPDGRSVLRFTPIKAFDAGIFKAIARNPMGDTSCRARLRLGDIPGRMEAPEIAKISEDQALVVWVPPKETGNTSVIGYELEYKEIDSNDWSPACKEIDHEFFVVNGLKPRTSYHFRCRAANKFGRGEFSVPSAGVVTLETGSEPFEISRAMKHQQQISERRTSRLELDVPRSKPHLDYSIEETGIQLSTDNPLDKFNIIAEISRGHFSTVMKCCSRDEEEKVFAAKLIDGSVENAALAKYEYEMLSKLRHERISCLHAAFLNNGNYMLIMDKLHGYDVLTYLTSRHQYTEDTVVKIISQLLDALQYLSFRNIVHLDIQPDNVVLYSLQMVQVKLIDFGSAQKVPRGGTITLDWQPGHLDYRAPEVINNGEVGLQADIWSMGVLAYVMLSGCVPFAGNDESETKENILYVRYRFENLYKEITQEATRFLMQIFKKTPFKRLTVDECLEHKWLNPSEFMLKKRERAIFLSSRLQQYSDEYHENRSQLSSRSEALANSLGVQFARSTSIEDKPTSRRKQEVKPSDNRVEEVKPISDIEEAKETKKEEAKVTKEEVEAKVVLDSEEETRRSQNGEGKVEEEETRRSQNGEGKIEEETRRSQSGEKEVEEADTNYNKDEE